MGRGNTCVFGEYEGLYYIDWDNFASEYEDEHGNIIHDYDFQRDEWENSLYQFISDFTRKFKSFSKCDEWINRDDRAILENKLFYIAITDNEWSVAIKLLQKEQGYYNDSNIENLQAKHYKTYLEGIKDCLFNQFEELGTYTGAWTSGRISRSEEGGKKVNIRELERKYGSVEHAGKKYILTEQASITSRLLPDHQKDCMELLARAIDVEGNDYVVYWIFKNDGRDLDMYDYDEVDRVEAL